MGNKQKITNKKNIPKVTCITAQNRGSALNATIALQTNGATHFNQPRKEKRHGAWEKGNTKGKRYNN